METFTASFCLLVVAFFCWFLTQKHRYHDAINAITCTIAGVGLLCYVLDSFVDSLLISAAFWFLQEPREFFMKYSRQWFKKRNPQGPNKTDAEH